MCCSRCTVACIFFIAGVDYTHESRNLILSRESITIDVKLINDNSLEGDEDFKVILQTMDLGKKIEDTIVLSKETAVVTIVDDDSKSSL